MAHTWVYIFVLFCLCGANAIKPKSVLELKFQQEKARKSDADCSLCTAPNQFCDFQSWTGMCKSCPVCGIDHFCDGRGYCRRCPGTYDKPTLACERVDAKDPKSDGTYVEGKPVRLVFATVGDDLFYLSAEPNITNAVVAVPATPPNITDNSTVTPAPMPTPFAVATARLSTTPSAHVIEEITAGSGTYRIRFNDTFGGFLRVVLPEETSDSDALSLIDLQTFGVSQILRDSTDFTTFSMEHSASFSWRFRVGSGDTCKYLAWCGESTCGMGVPALRFVSGMFCGSLTSAGIRCDVMISNN